MPKIEARSARSPGNTVYHDQADFTRAVEWLKAVSHPVRLQIIQLLGTRPLTVREVAIRLTVTPDIASKHLRGLHRFGILTRKPDGRKVSYSLRDPRVHGLFDFIRGEFAKGHVDGRPAGRRDHP